MTSYGTTLQLWRVQHIPANIRFVDGRLQTVEGEEKVVQDICILLRTMYGEDMFHRTFGFDSPRVVESRADKHLLEFLLRKALKTYPFLANINSIEIGDITSFREIPVTINLTTTEGSLIELSIMV